MGSRLLLAILDYVPPPPEKRDSGGGGGGYLKQLNRSIIVLILILTIVFLVSASLHLLLRFLERRRSSRAANLEAMEDQLHHHQATPVAPPVSLIDSLPVFPFDTVTGIRHRATDCVVCLSRFQPHDRLRLLPRCSHAFHASCIDSWLVTGSTCPLCRAEIVAEPGDASVKSVSAQGASFRLELGSLSRRRAGEISTGDDDVEIGGRRSYDMGSFEYVVDSSDGDVFVKVEPRQRHVFSDEVGTTVPEKEEYPAVEVEESGIGWAGNWLKEYMDMLASTASSAQSSRAVSFRSGAENEQSGYFFLWR